MFKIIFVFIILGVVSMAEEDFDRHCILYKLIFGHSMCNNADLLDRAACNYKHMGIIDKDNVFHPDTLLKKLKPVLAVENAADWVGGFSECEDATPKPGHSSAAADFLAGFFECILDKNLNELAYMTKCW